MSSLHTQGPQKVLSEIDTLGILTDNTKLDTQGALRKDEIYGKDCTKQNTIKEEDGTTNTEKDTIQPINTLSLEIHADQSPNPKKFKTEKDNIGIGSDLCMEQELLFQEISRLRERNSILVSKLTIAQAEIEIWKKANGIKKKEREWFKLRSNIIFEELIERKRKYYDLLHEIEKSDNQINHT